MSVRRRRNLEPDPLPGLATRLVRVLDDLLAGQRKLAVLLEQKREAIRTADLDAIVRLCEAENELAQRLGDSEKTRLHLVGQITEHLAPDAAQPLTITQIAEAVDDPIAQQLSETGRALREQVQQVRRQSHVLRSAAETLAKHMAGIAQTVRSALTSAQVYSRGGSLDTGAPLQCAIDITS
jgi:cell fate (sporulation/competence/biofilm development) regulator YlbF (YheA/YmcA/DUF963 family)